MMDNNVSTLPVLDNDGNLTGIIRSTDMLRALISREAIKAGGARGNRDGDEVKFPRGTEKESLSQVPVSELMDRMVNTSENHMNGQEAVENMLDNNQFDIVFVDGKYPETIIGIKDFIDHVAGMAPGKTVLVNLTGIDVPEEKAAIHEKIRKQLQGSLGRKLERAEEFDIRVKKAEKDGKKHRYEVDMKLSSEYGLTNINEEGWDLLEVIDEGLNEMNTVIRKEKEKREDRR
jgi:ribosome-associated translation inhibitor RaiA